MQQLASEGESALSLRGLAASLGLAPNALYRYFSDRAQLEAAMAAESLRRLHLVLKRAAGKKEPRQAIRAIALAYVRFAREHPHVYGMMLSRDAGPEGADVHQESWRFIVEQVGRLSGEAHAREASVALWAFLHGFTVLASARVFGKEKPSTGFEFGLDAWLAAASAASSSNAGQSGGTDLAGGPESLS